jgi:hypothetical protein
LISAQRGMGERRAGLPPFCEARKHSPSASGFHVHRDYLTEQGRDAPPGSFRALRTLVYGPPCGDVHKTFENSVTAKFAVCIFYEVG